MKKQTENRRNRKYNSNSVSLFLRLAMVPCLINSLFSRNIYVIMNEKSLLNTYTGSPRKIYSMKRSGLVQLTNRQLRRVPRNVSTDAKEHLNDQQRVLVLPRQPMRSQSSFGHSDSPDDRGVNQARSRQRLRTSSDRYLYLSIVPYTYG